MKSQYYLVLLLVEIINAKISIDIETGTNSSDVSIKFSGSDIKVISDHEIEVFQINNENLKAAAKKHYGRKPNNIYLKSPTPWGDLYKTYNWEEIKRVLSVNSARVKGVTKKPTLILSQDFENALNNTIKVNAGISQTVENTISTSWTKNKEIVLSQEVEYDLNVVMAKISGTTGFSYSTNWGKSEEHSETVIIGATSAVETKLQPGQQATAILTANRGYLEIEINYKTMLKGNLAVNFKKSYKGHHFWGPPIEIIMNDGGISNEITATEIIKVGFYVDATLKVVDKVSGKPL